MVPNWTLLNHWISELYFEKDWERYFLTILFSLIGNRCVEWGVDFKGNDVALKKGILHWEECANFCQGFMKLNLIRFKYWRYFDCLETFYTQPVQTLFLFKSIWIRPQGSQGCQKIHKNMLQIKVLSFCARNTPKRHKLRKIVKIEKKCQKNLVFLEYFEYSSIWRQY